MFWLAFIVDITTRIIFYPKYNTGKCVEIIHSSLRLVLMFKNLICVYNIYMYIHVHIKSQCKAVNFKTTAINK